MAVTTDIRNSVSECASELALLDARSGKGQMSLHLPDKADVTQDGNETPNLVPIISMHFPDIRDRVEAMPARRRAIKCEGRAFARPSMN
jgi:hypothetical protein